MKRWKVMVCALVAFCLVTGGVYWYLWHKQYSSEISCSLVVLNNADWKEQASVIEARMMAALEKEGVTFLPPKITKEKDIVSIVIALIPPGSSKDEIDAWAEQFWDSYTKAMKPYYKDGVYLNMVNFRPRKLTYQFAHMWSEDAFKGKEKPGMMEVSIGVEK